MNRVLVTFNPKLSRTDQGSLVQRVKQEADRNGCGCNDFFQSLLLIRNPNPHARDETWQRGGVPQQFIDAINGDPDMLALENFGDQPSEFGYVIPLISVGEVTNEGMVRVTFEHEEDMFLARSYSVRELYVEPLVVDLAAAREEASDTITIYAPQVDIEVELHPQDLLIVVSNIHWDELKNSRNEKYFSVIS